MINAEFFKEEIKKFDYHFGIDNQTNNLMSCGTGDNCYHCNFNGLKCNSRKIEWLLDDYNPIFLLKKDKLLLLVLIIMKSFIYLF